MKKASIFLIAILLILVNYSPVHAQPETSTDNEMIYYILIDRFVNGTAANDYRVNLEDPGSYHGGDIQGITNKLDHINDLGFTTINLSPIMSNSKDGYHGFLIDDYQTMEEQFGTIEDMNELVEQAHSKDMKVILDFPVSHISPDHSWLSEHSDGIDGEVSNQWGEQLPVLDLTNSDVRQNLINTAREWLEKTGVDGYRLYLGHNTSELFIDQFVEQIKSVDSNLMVVVDAANESDFENHSEVAIMDNQLYELMSTIFSSSGNQLDPLFDQWIGQQDQLKGIYIDSQQTMRFTRKAVNQGKNPITRWKLAYTFMYTVPGLPILYQGSEVPMDNGEDIPDHRMAQINSGDEELTQYIEKLADIRQQFPALTNGDLELIATNGAMALYKREHQDNTVYIAINNDVKTKTITMEDVPEGMQLTGILQDNIVRELDSGEYKMALDRETAEIFIVEEDKGLNWLYIGFVVLVIGGFVVGVIYLSKKQNKKD